jgi:hypothetical protein
MQPAAGCGITGSGGGMKKGDLVRVKAHLEFGTTAYPTQPNCVWVHISQGEVSMLLQDMKDNMGYINVLHPKHGICTISRVVLEVIVDPS